MYLSDYTCGGAGDDAIVRHIFGHYRAGGDDGVAAYGDAGEHGDVGTEPGVLFDDDGFGEQCVALGRLLGVVLCGEDAMWADEDVVLDGDAAEGEQGASEIEEAVAAEAYARAVVDMYGCEDAHIGRHCAARDVAQSGAHFFLGAVAAVHFGHQTHSALHFGIDGITADIFVFVIVFHNVNLPIC